MLLIFPFRIPPILQIPPFLWENSEPHLFRKILKAQPCQSNIKMKIHQNPSSITGFTLLKINFINLILNKLLNLY